MKSKAETLEHYPYRSAIDFFHLPWFVNLIEGKSVCDLGCGGGDGMVQMGLYASEVCGIERDRSLFQKAKRRGLNIVEGSYLHWFPKADIYYNWVKDFKDIETVISMGVEVIVFQSPNDWNLDEKLWDVQPQGFSVEPKINKEQLKKLEERMGGTLEFHSYEFNERESKIPHKFPPKGWRQVFVFHAKKEKVKYNPSDRSEPMLEFGPVSPLIGLCENYDDLQVLLIAGNHRSGSSMLAGLLSIAGGHIHGPLEGPDQFNGRGYFETKHVESINCQLMKEVYGHSWLSLETPPMDAIASNDVFGRLKKGRLWSMAKEWVEKNRGKRSFLIIKDPRISFLLPAYMRAFWSAGVKPKLLVSDRHDDEICKSLQIRNQVSQSDALTHIEATRRSIEMSLVDAVWIDTFSAFEHNPRRALQYLAEKLSLPIAYDDETVSKVEKFIDSRLRHHRARRNVKVISTYFGPRRTRPHLIGETIDWLKEIVELECRLDKGVFADTIIVNHDIAALMEGGEKAHDFLKSLDGTPTRNGVIRVINRPWDRGIGGSFRSFNYAFEMFRDKYDYWFFDEDNVVMIGERYFKRCIEQLQADSSIAFVGCHRTMSQKLTAETKTHHAHGGCGCIHVRDLNSVFLKRGSLPYSRKPMPDGMIHGLGSRSRNYSKEANDWYTGFQKGEIGFTHVYVKELGKRIVDLDLPYPVARHRGVYY
jgi:hypothetical protein